jgi:serine/threonine protein kinase
MASVEGASIAQKVAAGPQPRRAALLIKQVATPGAYAHTRGMIRCDKIPANILLHRSGQPCVTDFGLAKRNGAATYASGSTLAAPTNVDSASPGYFGPNFTFLPASVPEPSSLTLAGVAVISGLACALRRHAALTAWPFQPAIGFSPPLAQGRLAFEPVPWAARRGGGWVLARLAGRKDRRRSRCDARAGSRRRTSAQRHGRTARA